MKKTLTLVALLLGCGMAAVAQAGSALNQTPPSSTPSTLPQNQTNQTPSNPVTLADPSAVPPDSEASSSQSTAVQGCLSRSPDGHFILTDSSGNSFRLRGEILQLNSYLGKEVRLEGAVTSNDETAPNAMASSASATQLLVTNVHKLAESCAPGLSIKK